MSDNAVAGHGAPVNTQAAGPTFESNCNQEPVDVDGDAPPTTSNAQA